MKIKKTTHFLLDPDFRFRIDRLVNVKIKWQTTFNKSQCEQLLKMEHYCYHFHKIIVKADLFQD